MLDNFKNQPAVLEVAAAKQRKDKKPNVMLDEQAASNAQKLERLQYQRALDAELLLQQQEQDLRDLQRAKQEHQAVIQRRKQAGEERTRKNREKRLKKRASRKNAGAIADDAVVADEVDIRLAVVDSAEGVDSTR